MTGINRAKSTVLGRLLPILVLIYSTTLQASPMVPAGDIALRQDIQRLANHGIIRGTISTWPMAWGPILDDLRDADPLALPDDVADALMRVRQRASWETRSNEFQFNAKIGFADNATTIRSFQNTPRERVEISAGAKWIGDWFTADLNAQFVDSASDGEDVRFDNSLIGVAVGNWVIAASTQDRWWGPSWDGSVIMSNNARPIPTLTLDRVFTEAFESKWLSWMGPWDLSVMFGQLESERVVPNAQIFGMRFNFRPLTTLEIGLSRTAQWCGDDRPCDLRTFSRLLIGNDNRGDSGLTADTEPGNQLAGVDFRWTPNFLDANVGFYGQFIGEDEAGGLPSRYMGQLGAEWYGYLFDRWSTQVYAEYTATICQFYESSKLYNCAYLHTIYQTGYRYRGRPIGHGADNDAEIYATGVSLVDSDNTQWRVLLRVGELNRGGAPDPKNTITPTPQDILSFDLSHSRKYAYGVFDVGAGYEKIDDQASGSSNSDARLYVQWRSAF